MNAVLVMFIGDDSSADGCFSASCKVHIFTPTKHSKHCRHCITRWAGDLGRQRRSQNDATLISRLRPRALSVAGVARDVSHNRGNEDCDDENGGDSQL